VSNGIHITFQADPSEINKCIQDLNSLGVNGRKYMADALNKTATSARKKLAQKAQAEYTIKTGGFNKSMQIKKANAGNLQAVIRSTGDTINIKRFKTRSNTKSAGSKAQIVQGGGLKELRKDGGKAFNLSGFVAARTSASRLPIESFYSKSVPYMIGSERRVYGVLEPEINADLYKFMQQQIARAIGGG